ncbi:MAG: hypothetical protein AB7Q42_25050 [Acidimicrobiia bacterium]
MFQLDGTEIVGYAASALVVLSLAMTSVVRLRSISLAGSLIFVVYGILIDSIPIVLTNAAIAALNIWFLRAELGLRRDLGGSRIAADAPFLLDFIAFHLDDIRRFQPDFSMPSADELVLLLTRDGLPAGVVVGERHGTELELHLDYVLQAYRDSRLGHWLFGRGADVFRSAGISRLVTNAGNEVHRGYLERVGFTPAGDRYVLDLTT